MSQRTFLTPISGVWHGLGLGVLALLLAGVLPADKLGKMPGTPFLPNPQDFPLRFGMFVTKFMRRIPPSASWSARNVGSKACWEGRKGAVR